MTKAFKILMLGASIVAGVSSAHAQVDWSGMIQTEAMNSAIEDASRGGGSRARRPAGSTGTSLMSGLAQSFAAQTGPGTTPAMAEVSGRYTPSPAVRQKLAQIMGDAAAKQDAAAGADMRKLVLSGEAVNRYGSMAPSMGLRANDAVDAFAFYMLAQWGVANDYREMFTRAQVAGVRRQAANAYAGVADQLATDALRQEFGEMLVVQGMAMSGVHETAVQKGDEATAARAAQLARKGGVRIFTMDPTTIELTEAGFRKKG